MYYVVMKCYMILWIFLINMYHNYQKVCHWHLSAMGGGFILIRNRMQIFNFPNVSFANAEPMPCNRVGAQRRFDLDLGGDEATRIVTPTPRPTRKRVSLSWLRRPYYRPILRIFFLSPQAHLRGLHDAAYTHSAQIENT